jgi:basic membrane protein A
MPNQISRRQALQGTAAVAGVLPVRAALAADTVIGFIYVGSRDDYGYNQAHAAGAAALKKVAGIKVVEEEKVPETDAVEKTMESMINLDGATLLFPTSFGYFNPHVLKIAKKYLKVRFEHAGGLWTEKDPTNVGSYFGYIDEAQHVAGIVAGASTKTGKLGFVAAKPIPQLLRNVNAFILGAKLANPNATLQVIFTGDWSMPVKEAEATNSLIDAGVDVITCHVDGPKTVMENAARPRRHDLKLPRQRSVAGAASASHRRGVELGGALPAFRADVHQRRDYPEFLSWRPEGKLGQGRSLWSESLGSGPQAGRRRQDEAHCRRLRDFQGSAQGQ